MRIAFLTPEYVTESNYDGGLANYLHRVCLSLVKLGHCPVVIVTSDKNEAFVHHGIEVHRQRTFNKWISILDRLTLRKFSITLNWIWQSWVLNKRAKRIHKKNGFTIIQYASYTATGIFKLGGVPSVARISSYQPLIRKSYGLKLSLDQFISERLEEFSMAKQDGLFGPSTVISEIVGQAIDKKVEVIESPFTLDITEVDRQPYEDLLLGKKYILFFGSLGLLKGVGTIADMIEQLLQRHTELFFVFIGKDLGYHQSSMMEHVWNKAGSCRGRVLYLGKMSHKQLYPIIENAFAVVLPSRIDNFPNTCLEAMAHRRIVIGTKGTSFEQLITDGVNGFLCERDNPKDLLLTIEKVFNQTNCHRKQMSEKALERIKNLSPEIMVNNLVSYYQQIVKQNT